MTSSIKIAEYDDFNAFCRIIKLVRNVIIKIVGTLIVNLNAKSLKCRANALYGSNDIKLYYNGQ